MVHAGIPRGSHLAVDILRRCDPGYFGWQHLAHQESEGELTVWFRLQPPTMFLSRGVHALSWTHAGATQHLICYPISSSSVAMKAASLHCGHGLATMYCPSCVGGYRALFDRIAEASGIEIVRIPWRALGANATCERFPGSIRRECLDHLLIMSGRHLYCSDQRTCDVLQRGAAASGHQLEESRRGWKSAENKSARGRPFISDPERFAS